MTTKKSRVAIWKNRAKSFQRDVGALLANWRCVLVRHVHCATGKRRSVRLFSAWMTMIWTLRIPSRRFSSGERVGRAKVPVETLVMTERSAMSAMTAAKAMRRRLVMTVLRRTLEKALTVEVVEDDMGEWRRRRRGGGAAGTGKGCGRGGGRTTGAGRERGGGWRRLVRRKGRRCRCQRQNKQRYAKSKRMGRFWRWLCWYFTRFLPSCPSWSTSVRQIKTTTWCLKMFFTTDVAS